MQRGPQISVLGSIKSLCGTCCNLMTCDIHGGQRGSWPPLDFHTLSLEPPKFQKLPFLVVYSASIFIDPP